MLQISRICCCCKLLRKFVYVIPGAANLPFATNVGPLRHSTHVLSADRALAIIVLKPSWLLSSYMYIPHTTTPLPTSQQSSYRWPLISRAQFATWFWAFYMPLLHHQHTIFSPSDIIASEEWVAAGGMLDGDLRDWWDCMTRTCSGRW